MSNMIKRLRSEFVFCLELGKNGVMVKVRAHICEICHMVYVHCIMPFAGRKGGGNVEEYDGHNVLAGW